MPNGVITWLSWRWEGGGGGVEKDHKDKVHLPPPNSLHHQAISTCAMPKGVVNWLSQSLERERGQRRGEDNDKNNPMTTAAIVTP
jgi:hypothetical protein